MTHVYTVSFHPPSDSWLASARHHDRRVALAEMAVDAVSGDEEPTLVALPAGFLRAPSEKVRVEVAQSMLELSRRAQVGLVFGVDEATEDEWAPLVGCDAAYVYACDSGDRVLWPARQLRATTQHPPQKPPESRAVELGGQSVGVVVSAEAFNSALRLALTRASPDLILVLAHAAPTDRWSGAVASWNAIAPTFIVAPPPITKRETDPWVTHPPTGWTQNRMADTRDMTIRRYRCPGQPSAVVEEQQQG